MSACASGRDDRPLVMHAPGPGRLTAVVLTETFDPAADQQRMRACYEIVLPCRFEPEPSDHLYLPTA
jgi:hypothetical protein